MIAGIAGFAQRFGWNARQNIKVLTLGPPQWAIRDFADREL
jgi:hypothetical protein